MHQLTLEWSKLKCVLCLGAHCDDIEIGCAGTLLELRRRAPQAVIHWQILSGEGDRGKESIDAASALFGGREAAKVEVGKFPGSFFPGTWAEIKNHFEDIKTRIKPDLIFTHRRRDRHQDHQVVAELTWNTFRDHLILEYEIPKFEGDLGRPNVFVSLDAETAERKLNALMNCFPSQKARTWFRPEVFRGLMAIRGVECNSPSGFAEAFHGHKIVL
jgi:LmbE family N-acetylglucosaminyl deacetylase